MLLEDGRGARNGRPARLFSGPFSASHFPSLSPWLVRDWEGRAMNGLLSVLDRVSIWCLRFGGLLILLSAFLVTVDVVFRKLLGFTLGGADELSGYAFGIGTMLSLSAAMIGRSNIRIDIGYQAMPIPMRAIADLLALIALVGFIALVSWFAYDVLFDSIKHWSRSITPMRTPLAIPQAFWFAGMVLAVVTGVALIITVAMGILRRDWAQVQKVAGIKSVDEQIEEETK